MSPTRDRVTAILYIMYIMYVMYINPHKPAMSHPLWWSPLPLQYAALRLTEVLSADQPAYTDQQLNRSSSVSGLRSGLASDPILPPILSTIHLLICRFDKR